MTPTSMVNICNGTIYYIIIYTYIYVDTLKLCSSTTRVQLDLLVMRSDDLVLEKVRRSTTSQSYLVKKNKIMWATQY